MHSPRIHTRIVQHSFASLLQGARLDSYQENKHHLTLNVQGFQPVSSRLFESAGKILERVQGKHIPLKLIFANISKLKRDDFFILLENYLLDDPSRIIAYMFSWRQPNKQDIFYMFGLRGAASADMQFFAKNVNFETQESQESSFTVERDWSPAPPMPDRLVPQPRQIHRQFGGDPITIKLNHRSINQRLFIGGLDIQAKQRPQIDAILNLGEKPSNWVKKGKINPNDRAVEKGEGSQGMTMSEICNEANWVIERLKDNQRILVHCVAGMNRSSTVCCAVLILLEGLSAEKALERVREHHPWARPDSNHWLKLRWLAKNK